MKQVKSLQNENLLKSKEETNSIEKMEKIY